MMSQVCEKCKGNFLTIVVRKGNYVRMKCESCDYVFVIKWDLIYKKLVK